MIFFTEHHLMHNASFEVTKSGNPALITLDNYVHCPENKRSVSRVNCGAEHESVTRKRPIGQIFETQYFGLFYLKGLHSEFDSPLSLTTTFLLPSLAPSKSKGSFLSKYVTLVSGHGSDTRYV